MKQYKNLISKWNTIRRNKIYTNCRKTPTFRLTGRSYIYVAVATILLLLQESSKAFAMPATHAADTYCRAA
jgi:hypothetical protein